MHTPFFRRKYFWIITTISAVMIFFLLSCGREEPIDFSTDVKPIINRKCITCHGGVRAKGGFSLLFRDQALAKTVSGKPAIIPGNPDSSEMIRRLTLSDPEDRMPYKHEPLSKEEIGILTKWVRQGAKWGDHWAYLPVKPVPPPAIEAPWIKNDIDRFILSRLQQEKITPSEEAPKSVLLRRVSLDLIGMQAPPSLGKQFLQRKDPGAYATLVDSLLASPHCHPRDHRLNAGPDPMIIRTVLT